MTYKTIRWGIIAPGKIGRKFAEDLRHAPGASLHAVAASSYEKASAFAADFNVPHVYGNYRDMMACPGLDVVYIASPHAFHTEHTLMCLENGLAVLCEKPFAMNGHSARKMIALARKNNLFLMEALWTRFIPATVQALEWVDNGYIGNPHTLTADFGFKSPYNPDSRLYNIALGGGSLLDIGIYPALMALIFFGKPATADIRAAATFAPTGADLSTVFSFSYPGNRLATGHSTFAANTPVEATLYGDEAALHFSNPFHHTERLRFTRYNEKSASINIFPTEGWGYQYEAMHVNDCLRLGLTESPVIPHQFTLDLIDTLDAIREKTGLVYPHDTL